MGDGKWNDPAWSPPNMTMRVRAEPDVFLSLQGSVSAKRRQLPQQRGSLRLRLDPICPDLFEETDDDGGDERTNNNQREKT